jgi:hypothetical protein
LSTTVASQEVIGLDENVQFKMTGSDHPVTCQKAGPHELARGNRIPTHSIVDSPTICINKDPEAISRLGVFAFS